MKNFRRISAVLIAAVFVGLYFLLRGQLPIQDGNQERLKIESGDPTSLTANIEIKAKQHASVSASRDNTSQTDSASKEESIKLSLTKENFEEFVNRCFQGEPCEFGEDPWVLYEYYKRSQHPRTCDSIIAFLRKKMSQPEYKDKYKDLLLRMIKDFYPSREIDFQLAAYYAYLGNLEKSLGLYLDLEKKAAQNPDLRKAPKLNIANVYYDLHRYREALPYYRSALQKLLNEPDQRPVTEFVQNRISEIESKL